MLDRNFNRPGNRIALFIGQLIVLIICISYMEYIYTVDIFPDRNADLRFKSVACTVANKKLRSNGSHYRADFTIVYDVEGVRYQRIVSGNGLDASYHDLAGQQRLLIQYNINGVYKCYYDPENPEVSVLILRKNWVSTFPLLVPAVITVIILYFLLDNLFQLILVLREKINK